jgi:hypothetical protein
MFCTQRPTGIAPYAAGDTADRAAQYCMATSRVAWALHAIGCVHHPVHLSFLSARTLWHHHMPQVIQDALCRTLRAAHHMGVDSGAPHGAVLHGQYFTGSTSRAVLHGQYFTGSTSHAVAQVIEDALCLVFLERQFADFGLKEDEEKMVNIIRKTWRKMGEGGRAAALKLQLPEEEMRLVTKALSE